MQLTCINVMRGIVKDVGVAVGRTKVRHTFHFASLCGGCTVLVEAVFDFSTRQSFSGFRDARN